MVIVFEELSTLSRSSWGEVLLAEHSQQTLVAMIERDVFDLVPENCCKPIFAVEESQDAIADEDLTAR